MEADLIYSIVAGILSLAAVVLGPKWAKAQATMNHYGENLGKVFKEAEELISVVNKANADSKITNEELKNVVAKTTDLGNSIKAISAKPE